MSFFRERSESLVYLLALSARLAVFFLLIVSFGAEGLTSLGDSHQYLQLARGMLDSRAYVDPGYPGLVEGTRAPGYPAFLWFFLWSGIPLWAASLLQIAAASFIPVLTMKLSARFGFSPAVSVWAGILMALEPLSVVYAATLLSDALAAFLFLLGAYWLVRAWQESRVRFVAAASLALALMNYIRPIGLYLYILVPLVLLVFALASAREKIARALGYSAVFAVCFYALLLPWLVRNYVAFGEFQFLSAVERHLYDYSAVAVRAAAEGKTYEEMRQTMRREITPLLPEPRDIRAFPNRAVLREKAIEIIRAYPKEYLKLYAFSLQTLLVSGNYHYLLAFYDIISPPAEGTQSFTVLFSSVGIEEAWRAALEFVREPYGLIALLGRAGWALVFLLSLIGAALAWVRAPSSRLGIVLYVGLLGYLATVTLTLVTGLEARHRLFINPFYFIFAAYGIWYFFLERRRAILR